MKSCILAMGLFQNGGIVFLLAAVFSLKPPDHLKGNHKKLGEQCKFSVKTEELQTVPQPLEFYEKFVRDEVPVVFRGAAKRSRAYAQWTEDYLIDQFGNLTVRVEARSEQNEYVPEGAVGIGLDQLGRFLRSYQEIDGYVITQLPEPMERDVSILPCLRCGTFLNSIQEVHVFLSAYGGKTGLHKDPYNNIHCVFNGTKDWILVHPDQTDKVYMSEDSYFEWGGISDINVDNVDLQLYPKIADIQYSMVRLHRGDCIYMPSGHWHQVRSFGEMNTAVAIWFSILDSFENIGCEGQTFDFASLNTVPVIWRYSGYGNLTQGHMDIYVLKKALMLWADESGRIDLVSFVQRFFVLLDIRADKKAMKINLEKRKLEFVRYLDTKDGASTTKRAVDELTIKQLKDLAEIIHPNDIANTDVYEYGHVDADEIRQITMESLYENGTFNSAVFIKRYTKELGGTKAKGNEILAALEIPKNGTVSLKHILDRIDIAVEKYSNALVHDSATEKQIFKFLKFGKKYHPRDEL